MSTSNLDQIFEQWKASLKTRDRSIAAVPGNFDELFSSLKAASATAEEARVILAQAIKAHLPAPAVARNTYRSAKHNPKIAAATEKEFIDKWNSDIADLATTSYYDAYPLPKVKDPDDDGEPKVYGNMSAREYKVQRRYADQFPILNTEELEQKMLSGIYDPVNDIANILGKKKDDNGNAE